MHRRAWRNRAAAFLVEGPLVVDEALTAGLTISEVFVRSDDADAEELAQRCRASGAAVFEVSDSVIRTLGDTATSQGIVAVAAMPSSDLKALEPTADLVLVLDEVRDPGNAGTLVRSAVAAGADCVVFSSGSVDPFGPKTVRASAGAIFKVMVARDQDLELAAALLKQRGFETIAAEGTASVSVFDLDLSRRVAFVVGNEAHGLGRDDLWDAAAAIPLAERVESLNVAVAGSIFLFEAIRQRRLSSARDG